MDEPNQEANAGITPEPQMLRLVEIFCRALGEVMSEALGSAWKAEPKAEENNSTDLTAPLSFELTLSGAAAGKAAFQLAGTDARSLAAKLLKEPSDATSELNAEHRAAIEKLLKQVNERASPALQEEFGDLTVQISGAGAPAWAGKTIFLVASAPPEAPVSVRMKISTEVLAALPAKKNESKHVPPVKETPDTKLDLVLGVDLNLSLRFGQRTLMLRELLDLGSGSVIELDREVQEPADLLLGGKLIARGEVVIADGKYGLRVTEVYEAALGAANRALSGAM